MYDDANKRTFYARKCELRTVGKDEYRAFVERYHTQGWAKMSVAYGLCHDGELLQVMSFGQPRFAHAYQWELIRECSKDNVVVIGGTSRLWTAFVRECDPASCICYSYPHMDGHEITPDELRDMMESGEYKTTSHYVEHCGFVNISPSKYEDKVWYVGQWGGKEKKISSTILARLGVDRLLHLDVSAGTDRSNERILIEDFGFRKVVEPGLSPQIDVWSRRLAVNALVSEDGKRFFIGCSLYPSDDYTGTLSDAQREALGDYTVQTLRSDFHDPKDMFAYAVRRLRSGRYAAYARDGKSWRKSNDTCLNDGTETGEGAVCAECGRPRGKHGNRCSHYVRYANARHDVDPAVTARRQAAVRAQGFLDERADGSADGTQMHLPIG